MTTHTHFLALSFLLLAVNGPAAAASRYDGEWEVGITAESGECKSGYLLPIRVTNGVVSYNGEIKTTAKGTISESGKVALQFTHEQDQVSAEGQLNGTIGRGKWTSPTLRCTGRWEATKH